MARLKASLVIVGLDDCFVEGYELPADIAKRIPERCIGRLLSADEAGRVLDLMANRPMRLKDIYFVMSRLAAVASILDNLLLVMWWSRASSEVGSGRGRASAV